MTTLGKIAVFRSVITEEIKMNVKSIYNKLYGEPEEDMAYVLEMSDVTQQDVSVMLYDCWQDLYYKVYLISIVVTDDDVYMTGYTETGDDVDEIYFDVINTDNLAKVSDVLWNKNYKL